MTTSQMPEFLSPCAVVSLRGPAAGLALAEAAAPGRSLSRPFRLEKQRQTEWCWAAVGSAVRKHRGGPIISQCQVASRVWPGYNCCGAPASCNSPATLEQALTAIGHLRSSVYDSISLERIDQEIRGNRPICCALTGGNWGHAVVITGWYRSGATLFVTIEDPSPDTGQNISVEYSQLLAGYRDCAWADSYLVS